MSVRMSDEQVWRHEAKLRKPQKSLTTFEKLKEELDEDERKLQEHIAQYLRMRKIPFFRQRMDKRTTGTLGWPDFSFVLPGGKACFFECKVAGRKLTEEQEQVRQRLVAAGANYSIIYDLAQAIAAVKVWSEMP